MIVSFQNLGFFGEEWGLQRSGVFGKECVLDDNYRIFFKIAPGRYIREKYGK